MLLLTFGSFGKTYSSYVHFKSDLQKVAPNLFTLHLYYLVKNIHIIGRANAKNAINNLQSCHLIILNRVLCFESKTAKPSHQRINYAKLIAAIPLSVTDIHPPHNCDFYY